MTRHWQILGSNSYARKKMQTTSEYGRNIYLVRLLFLVKGHWIKEDFNARKRYTVYQRLHY